MSARFRAGLVGAGNISKVHVEAVRALPGLVELVGVTDLDLARASTAAANLGVRAYASLDALVEAGANVVHVLTPPAAHVPVAMAALERGCHVLVEKPISEDEAEARKLASLAKERGLTLTVNHSLLYDPQVKRALEVVRSGALGEIVSVDVLRGSSYPTYEGGPLPPWYRSAGYPFRDLGVHCLYLLARLLGPIESVEGEWRSLGGDPNLAFDEWRVIVRAKRGLGQLQLTYNVKPIQSQVILHGTRGILRVDLFAMFHGRRSATSLPKPAERVVNALTDSVQPLVDVPLGVWRFARRKVRPYQGIRDFVADFYRRLDAGRPPPVSAEEAIAIVPFVEKIARAAERDHAQRLARFPLSPKIPFVVTGASGALGSAVVRRLVAQGKRVRAFVRRQPEHPIEGVEYAFGDLGDSDAVDRAIAGAERVVHAGAAMKGGWPEHHAATVIGTQNVLDACKRHGVSQLLHVSSLSVLDWAGASGKRAVTEDTPLEPRPDERGAYTRAKLEAERRVSAAARAGLACVILRPGQIFGGGIPLVTGAVARRVGGRWVLLGDGKLELPLVYIDDVVDAILAAIDKRLTRGEIVHVVDDARFTQREVLALAGEGLPVIKLPRSVVFALGKLSELPSVALGRPSPVALYRLRSALAHLRFESDRAEELLGWAPRVGVREGIRRVTSAHTRSAGARLRVASIPLRRPGELPPPLEA